MSTLQTEVGKVLEDIFGKVNAFNLQGKDYFSEKEAAHYMCVSLRYFREVVKEYGIVSLKVLNKKVYRKTDLQAAIERGAIDPVLPH